MVILQILATTGLTLVLYLTGVFVVFTPLPILLTVWKKGPWPAAAATILSLAVLVGLYRTPGPLGFLPMMVFYPDMGLTAVTGLSLVYFFYYLVVGWVVAYASYRPWGRIELVCAGMTFAILAFPGLAIFLVANGMGVDLLAEASRAMNGLFQKMLDLQNGTGISPEDFAYLREQSPTLVSRVMGVMPALWIDFTLLVLSLNILFLRKWVGLDKKPFPSWIDFSLWRLGDFWIWATIGVGGLFFLNFYLLGLPPLEIILTNILIVLAAVYFCQGLAITSFFFRKRLSPLVRLLFYAAIFLFLQVAGVVVMAVGLFDFWFDFRKLKRVGNSPLSPS